jgi:hypothetical protein
MTPKEKAKELVDKFYNEVKYYEEAKQCALITVDEVINYCHAEHIEYWQEVKQEILNNY